MLGVVLAAGHGSRLRPLTSRWPKPLLPLGADTLLDRLARQARAAGAGRVVCNAHHRAEDMVEHCRLHPGRAGGPVEVRVEPELRGPAGTLHTFAEEIRDSGRAVVLSGDLRTGGGLPRFVAAHEASGALLSVALVHVPDGSRYGVFEFDEDGAVARVEEKPAWAAGRPSWVSAGIYCVEPEVLSFIPQDRPFDFAADLVPALLAAGQPVNCVAWAGAWDDLGTPSAYRAAVLHEVRAAGGEPTEDGGVCLRDPSAVVEEGAALYGDVYLGAGVRVGAGAQVRDCVLLPGARLAPGGLAVETVLAGPAGAGGS
ncbi:sugar phosphate nucleotidyltransferase [Streptomyces sp. NPDC059445]|uniref:sugar phosphate nucleotidyltransferase n=1 Tax=Streptomyces sp. NPDC059445 TaxID=3346832 RepID=UPI00368000E0